MDSSTSNENDAAVRADRSGDHQWFIVGRWMEYEGESRTNVLRLLGIAAFYVVELINYYGLQLGFFEMPKVVGQEFHRTVTAVALAWTMVGLGVLYCQSHRIFPPVLKFISTGADIVLLTFILLIASGPQSPLLVVYFVIVALSALRFNLPLVRFATLGSMASYVFLLGYAKWFATDLRVPRYHQILFLLALGLTGIVIGQVIRFVRRLATDYATRMQPNKEET